jgi:hypothetical protein
VRFLLKNLIHIPLTIPTRNVITNKMAKFFG